MKFEPAKFNGTSETRRIFSGRALVAEQERAVEFLNVDAAVLDRLEDCACSIRRRAAFSGSA